MATRVLSITIDKADLDRVAVALRDIPHKIPVAQSAAINRTLKSLRKIIVSGVQKETTIKSRNKIIRKVDVRNSTPRLLAGAVQLQGRPLGAINFQYAALHKGGVMVRFGSSETAVPFFAGFLGIGVSGKRSADADATSTNRHLWLRVKESQKREIHRAHHKPNIGRKMQLIRPIYGPRLDTIYRRSPTLDLDAKAAARYQLSKNIDSQIARFLNPRSRDKVATAE